MNPGRAGFDAAWRGLFPDARTLLAGCGFALAFGWLWFPSLRDALPPALFADFAFRPAVFGLALCAGFLAGAVADGAAFKGGVSPDARQMILLSAMAAHGLALALLGLVFLTGGTGAFAGITANVSLGLAGALPGVWWTSRLLALGPQRAVAALAVAAFAALVLSLPLSRLALTPNRALCVLAAGIGLACALARSLAAPPSGPERTAAEPDTTPAESRRPESSLFCGRARAVALCGVAALFFGIGSLNVLVPAGGTASGLTKALGHVHALAHACALALAAVLLKELPGRNGGSSSGRNGVSPPGRILAAAAGALALLAFCLFFFPAAALFHAGAALPEAAGLALCAALCQDDHAAGHPAWAGLFLALTLAAVNGGWMAGLELARFAGKVGPALPGLAVALLLGAALCRERKRKSKPRPDMRRKYAELAASLNPALTGEMTEGEQALAFLLVQGHSNKAAAEALDLSENTVRWYIKKLNKKTGAADRAALIAALNGE